MATTYAVPDGRVAMAAATYTANASTQTISNAVNGVSFQPDFVWTKSRAGAYSHELYDVIRGVNTWLQSNSTTAEQSGTLQLTSFNSNGFTLGSNENSNYTNGYAAVAWNWKAGGAGVSNTAGTITSSVSANTTAGFSVVTYTGNGSASQTVGHGLGVAPSLVIFKVRSTTDDWLVYSSTLGANSYLVLDSTAAAGTAAGYFSGMTSSVIGLGYGASSINGSGRTFVAYCWAQVAGYSKFGSYTGNASADGPFVYLGFRPRYVMIKNTSTTSDWYIIDTSRNPYNAPALALYADSSTAEVSSTWWDILSNGFKLRNSAASINGSGNTLIYAAFAENPFKYANAY
jgi:hypothetical protein